MTRKFKSLGHALVMVLVVGAAWTSVASATEFTASKYSVTYVSEPLAEPIAMTIDGFGISCNDFRVHGTWSGPSTTATIEPGHTCTAFGLGATMTANGCHFLVHLPAGTATHVQVPISLVCPANKEITVDAASGVCVAHIPPFPGMSHATVSNSGSHINIKLTLNEITATVTDVSPFFCPFNGHTHVSNGVLVSGTITVKGSEGKTIDIG